MAHKKSLEALNRTLQDLRGNEQLFGGALILLAGDFRQTLPVTIPRSTTADGVKTVTSQFCISANQSSAYVRRRTHEEFSPQCLKPKRRACCTANMCRGTLYA
ncbi:hypothetical protein TNCV_3200551 [Trichonephila clavipes]|nr:hypothetical protein TNCV_3200551 [Trichonephila clavipes]